MNAQQRQEIRALVDLREDVQRTRIQFSNRIGAIDRLSENGNGNGHVAGLAAARLTHERYAKRFSDLEQSINDDLAQYVAAEPDGGLFSAVTALRGIGPLLAVQLLVEIDFTRASTVSALWKYAGYAPGFDRLKKGELRGYNARLKKIMYLIGASFLKARSPYREVYDRAKARYVEVHPDWTKAHCHLAALRAMNKRFLAHLYEVGRTLEGLPVRAPYVADYLGHEHIDSPEDYGWPPLSIVYAEEEDYPTRTSAAFAVAAD